MTAVALLGQLTGRIEIGTAVMTVQSRHPLIMAQQALATQVACAGAGGTILWMADERAIGGYVAPGLTEAARGVGRRGIRVVAGVPVALCKTAEVDDARVYAEIAFGCSSTAMRSPGCAATTPPASPISPPG